MSGLLARIWRLIRGPLQWYVLWLAHHKFIIGVCGVVFDDRGQILLLRHRYWEEGSWGLPSGYVESGERLEDALVREVREETGLVIQPPTVLRIVSGYRLRLEVSYVSALVGGSLEVDSREILEARFFTPDGLPSRLLESHREAIELALAKGDVLR